MKVSTDCFGLAQLILESVDFSPVPSGPFPFESILALLWECVTVSQR